MVRKVGQAVIIPKLAILFTKVTAHLYYICNSTSLEMKLKIILNYVTIGGQNISDVIKTHLR